MITTENILKRIYGRRRGGNNSIKTKTGIWSLPKEQQNFNAKKGAKRVALLMQDPAYRELHSMKIRYGKLKKKFNRLTFQE